MGISGKIHNRLPGLALQDNTMVKKYLYPCRNRLSLCRRSQKPFADEGILRPGGTSEMNWHKGDER